MSLKKVLPFQQVNKPDMDESVPVWLISSTLCILRALKLKDQLTYYHCLRVGTNAFFFAKAMGLSEEEQIFAKISGMLHDIGKIGIDNSVIYKPDRLNEEEFLQMKSHPEMSIEVVKPFFGENFYNDIQQAVLHHHERVDGRGYPFGLEGNRIPFLARLLTIVDTYDAMNASRPYRKGLPEEVIYKEFKRCSGTQFDSDLVKGFLDSHKFWNSQVKDQLEINNWVEKAA